jgi:hypothetical protein
MSQETESVSITLKISSDVERKFTSACEEIQRINPILKFDVKSLISLTLETADYDELIENMIIFEDRRLRQKIEELKKAKKTISVRAKGKEEAAA